MSKEECKYCGLERSASGCGEDIGSTEDEVGMVYFSCIYGKNELRVANELNTVEMFAKINYCPMCGRDLND